VSCRLPFLRMTITSRGDLFIALFRGLVIYEKNISMSLYSTHNLKMIFLQG
jgi:hypothetical protein